MLVFRTVNLQLFFGPSRATIFAVGRPLPIAMAVIVVGAVGACTPVCGIGDSKFSLSGAHVLDSVYTCPIPSNHRSYDINGTVAANNPTGKPVSISSVSTVMTVVAKTPDWSAAVGDTYETADISFSPKSIGSGSKATLKFAIPGWCSDSQHTGRTDTHADYTVAVTVVTSTGTFKLNTNNRHRLVTP